MKYFHSVRLLPDDCKGCVNCLKRCPTEAIRIREGKAQIIEERCIDCGECIRRCPNHAKIAVTDSLDDLKKYKYNIALPAPSLYAQFDTDTEIEMILCAFFKLGFDDVFEVAIGAELVALAALDYLKVPHIKKPVISNACPAVIRLIQVNFPELLDFILPFDAPVEAAARLARKKFMERVGCKAEEVGTWFISPCPAKMTTVRQPLGQDVSNLSGVIGMSKIYGEILKALPKKGSDLSECKAKMHDCASWGGVCWGIAGGESKAVDSANVLVVHGIHNVKEVFEQLSLLKLKDIDHIEVLACSGGCIGGCLAPTNRFVAEHRMKWRLREMEARKGDKFTTKAYTEEQIGGYDRVPIEPRSIMSMDKDIFRAMQKIEVMEKTLEILPGLDCGSCGSPTCKALAEDIAQGIAVETDCIFKLREKIRDMARDMVDIVEKLPPPLENEKNK